MKKFLIIALALLSLANAKTLEEIKASGVINIGVRDNFPPFSVVDQNGNFNGFEVELAKEIGKRIVGKAGTINLIGVNSKTRFDMLEDGSIDIAVAQFSVTPERKKQLDFSIPYFSEYMAILSQSKYTSINDIKNLLVIPGTTSDEFINENPSKFTGKNIIKCQNATDCFSKLKEGIGDGYFHTAFALAPFTIMDSDYSLNIKVANSENFISVGLKKGRGDKLESEVNKAIIDLSMGKFFQQAYDLSLEPYYKGSLERKHFLLDDLYKALM